MGAMPGQWVSRYIGLPFAEHGRGPRAYDCWGLVRLVLAEQFGVRDLPDYAARYISPEDRATVPRIFNSGLAASWRRVPDYARAPGQIAVFNLAGKPMHVGVLAADAWMLHTLAGTASCLEPLAGLSWRNRLEGVYRWRGEAG